MGVRLVLTNGGRAGGGADGRKEGAVARFGKVLQIYKLRLHHIYKLPLHYCYFKVTETITALSIYKLRLRYTTKTPG